MADDNRILELVEEALCSDLTPEEVCEPGACKGQPAEI
jgi:hypothetical protein